jgi:hypothetical protein
MPVYVPPRPQFFRFICASCRIKGKKESRRLVLPRTSRSILGPAMRCKFSVNNGSYCNGSSSAGSTETCSVATQLKQE